MVFVCVSMFGCSHLMLLRALELQCRPGQPRSAAAAPLLLLQAVITVRLMVLLLAP